MIISPRNPKLTLARVLQERRRRDREGLFVTEGEDLLVAGRAAGREPVHLLCAAGSGIEGDEVEAEILSSASALGSGTRVLAIWQLPDSSALGADSAVCVYLHGVGDPGNVGTIVRSADALVGATVVLGPECADPYGPRALRSTMGSIFTRPPGRGVVGETPEPRAALIAHGGRPLADGIDALLRIAQRAPEDSGREPLAEAATGEAGAGAGVSLGLTLCLGAERDGLPVEVLERCDETLTISLRPGGAESLNVAAAAAIALHQISSAASGGQPDG
jgi:TrmH family RNA methyltransferase